MWVGVQRVWVGVPRVWVGVPRVWVGVQRVWVGVPRGRRHRAREEGQIELEPSLGPRQRAVIQP